MKSKKQAIKAIIELLIDTEGSIISVKPGVASKPITLRSISPFEALKNRERAQQIPVFVNGKHSCAVPSEPEKSEILQQYIAQLLDEAKKTVELEPDISVKEWGYFAFFYCSRQMNTLLVKAWQECVPENNLYFTFENNTAPATCRQLSEEQNERLRRLQLECERLTENKQELEGALQSVESFIQKKNKERDALINEVDTLQKELKAVKEQMSEAQAQKEKVYTELEKVTQEYKPLRKEYDMLQEKLRSLENEVEQFKADLPHKKISLEQSEMRCESTGSWDELCKNTTDVARTVSISQQKISQQLDAVYDNAVKAVQESVSVELEKLSSQINSCKEDLDSNARQSVNRIVELKGTYERFDIRQFAAVQQALYQIEVHCHQKADLENIAMGIAGIYDVIDTNILKAMGVKEIRPKPGDAFNMLEHSTQNGAGQNAVIESLVVPGYKLGYDILRQAIVTTQINKE